MIPLVKKLDIDEINTSLIAIRKLLNNVGITETNITNVINNNSSGSGLPLGSWISFENDIAPNNNWIRAGTTFDATKYPSLDLYLGGNTVPERYDHSRLGDYESITLSTDSNNPTVMEYDGFLTVSNNGMRYLTINNLTVLVGDSYSGSSFNGTYCTPIKKGDRVYVNYSFSIQKIRFYKHPLFIKATS